jgi:cytochrome c oxidase subunit II
MNKKTWLGFRILTMLAFVATIVLAVTGCGNSFDSNGQRIYFTATSVSGEAITSSGGPGMMMMRLACVNCHRPGGHGGRINMMMYSVDVPNISWPELTAQDMDHPPYTEETLKRAIIQGIDPAGSPLKYPMPRWRMSDNDLNDLVNYIETLK